MKTIILGAALALGAGTMAQAQSFDADRQLQTFTTSAFKATLSELGASYSDREGVPNMSITFQNGMKADGLLMACQDQETSANCYGTSILATFSKPSGASNADVLDAINEFNYRENFGRAYLTPEGTISLRMYIISDGKITMENYRRQILLFINSAADFTGYLYGE